MKNKAFTLIELLVVITIIGILSGIVIVAIGDAVGRARIAGSQRFSHSIRTRLALDMVGMWPFDNNTVDHSGWNNHGTLVTGTAPTPDPCAVRYPTGVTGQAICLNGVNDWVNLGNRSSLHITGPITVEAWVNMNSLAGTDWGPMIANKYGGNWRGWVLFLSGNTGRPEFLVSTPSIFYRALSPTPITTGSWYHLVGVWNGSTVFIYVNGRLMRSSPAPAMTAVETQIAAIGKMAWANFGHVNGNIDEVRIFRAALPTSYIQKRYVQGIKDLVANSGITQQEKQERIAELRNSGQLVIDLDAALVGPIDFSPYAHYFEALSLEATE